MLDLTLSDQVLDRTGNIFDRHIRITAVLVEQVNAVGLEPLERCIGDFTNTLWPAVGTSGGVAALEAKLGGDHHLVAERRKRFADNLFIDEGAVSLGGVEKGDAAFNGRA